MSYFATISYLDKAFVAKGNDTLQFEAGVSVENRLTVTVLASISVNMNSPPSKSPFRYNSALRKRARGAGDQNRVKTELKKWTASVTVYL